MKKQTGFTLIELLLVLAIIGIISAIAIPALLSQRARARDKSSVSNLDSAIADMVGQWDKAREAGSDAAGAIGHVASYMKATHANDKDPWNTGILAYVSTLTAETGKTTASEFNAIIAAAASTGQVKLYYQLPAASVGGFVGGAVLLNAKMNGSTTFKKCTAIE
jgi:prepilin-type N-terminal cleavage/methylation domain-containing protein